MGRATAPDDRLATGAQKTHPGPPFRATSGSMPAFIILSCKQEEGHAGRQAALWAHPCHRLPAARAPEQGRCRRCSCAGSWPSLGQAPAQILSANAGPRRWEEGRAAKKPTTKGFMEHHRRSGTRSSSCLRVSSGRRVVTQPSALAILCKWVSTAIPAAWDSAATSCARPSLRRSAHRAARSSRPLLRAALRP